MPNELSRYEASSSNLEEMLTTDFKVRMEQKRYAYFVPKYQRPYSWTKKLIITLWEDILHTINEDDYPNVYFGSVVMNYSNISPQRENERDFGKIEIVDGQQRLVTLTIFLSVIRDICFEMHKESGETTYFQLADNLHQNFIKLGDRPKSYVLVRDSKHSYYGESYKPKDLFEEHIIKFDKPNSYSRGNKRYTYGLLPGLIKVKGENYPLGRDTLSNDSYKYRDHYRTLFKLLKDEIKKTIIIHDESIDNEISLSKIKLKDTEKVEELIRNIIETITKKLIFTKITINKDYEAYEYFESINSKKLELNASDLIRNQLFKINTPSKHREIQELWDNIESNIRYVDDTRKVKISMVDFFVYYWSSKYSYVSSRKLYKEILETLKKESLNAEGKIDKEKHRKRWMTFIKNLSKASNFIKLSFSDSEEQLNSEFNFLNNAQKKSLFENIYFLSRVNSKTWMILILGIFRNFRKLHNEEELKDISSKYLPQFFKFSFFYFNILSEPANWYHKQLYELSSKIDYYLSKKAEDRYDSDGKALKRPKELLRESLMNFNNKVKEIDAITFYEKLKEQLIYKNSDSSKNNIRSFFHIYEISLKDGSPDYPFNKNQIVNIEHIFPQTYDTWIAPKRVKELSKEEQKYVEKIKNNFGNLFLIYYKPNRKVGNHKIENKLSKYRDSHLVLRQCDMFIRQETPIEDNLPKIDTESAIYKDWESKLSDTQDAKDYLEEFNSSFVFKFKEAEKLEFDFNIKLRSIYLAIHMYQYYRTGFDGRLSSIYV